MARNYQLWKEKCKNEKLCHRCGKQSRKNKVFCLKCATYLNKYNSKRISDKRNKGICVMCTKLVYKNYARCKSCLISNRIASKAKQRRLRAESKKLVLEHYGNKCACTKCPETNIKFLTIDHIMNNGARHRANIKSSGGLTFYQWLKYNNFPAGYQILCWNCNSGRHLNGGKCPHME